MKGIYRITNLINRKVYVGQSVNLEGREKWHFKALLKNSHPNMYLQRSFNKYGLENFVFEILEITTELDDREMFWIDHLKSTDREIGFNLTSGGRFYTLTDDVKFRIANGVKGFYAENEDRRLLLSKRMTGENNPFYGKTHDEETTKRIVTNGSWYKHSDEIKLKMSEQRSGEKHPNFGRKFNAEWRKNLSEAHKGQKAANKINFSDEERKKIVSLYKSGEFLEVISERFSCSRIPITRVLKEEGVYKNKNPKKPLSSKDIEDIKKKLDGGQSIRSLAENYNLSFEGLRKKLKKLKLI